MFKSISGTIPYPQWATPRFKSLDALDRMLDGTFYDHLGFDFYTETDAGKNYVPLQQRRPSVMSGFAGQTCSTIARALFSGRRAPRVTHDNPEIETFVRTVIAQSGLFERMEQAALWGSVGAVAVTFRLVNGRLRVDVWRAKVCRPHFNAAGDLDALRVNYVTSGVDFLRRGLAQTSEGEPVRADSSYWYIKDITATQEINYLPVEDAYWSPDDLDAEPPVADISRSFEHGFGFVPGVWVANLPGGSKPPDGVSTFGPVASNIIEMDYTFSQLGRGIRYNAAPQLVVIGDTQEDSDPYLRSPTNVIHLRAQYKNGDQTDGGSDAKLLEMVGNGTQVGINYVEILRKITFEAMCASHKAPETLRGTVSGRAMEILDDAFYDLVYALRGSYGDSGLVPLLSKIIAAYGHVGGLPASLAGLDNDVLSGFGLRWRRLYPATPQDEMSIVQSTVMAVQNGLMDEATGRAYISAQLDLDIYDVPTPPESGADAQQTAPKETPSDQVLDGDAWDGGATNPDSRRQGPAGTSIPRRRVGSRQKSIEAGG